MEHGGHMSRSQRSAALQVCMFPSSVFPCAMPMAHASLVFTLEPIL